MDKGRNSESRIGMTIGYIYILLPFMIFLIGWTGKRYWILLSPILLFCFWKSCKDTPAMWVPKLNRDNVVKILVIILTICVWTYFSGIGKFVFQNEDHGIRNAIFEVLVKEDWPIRNYNIDYSFFPQETLSTSLIYYIGFWMPSAVIGKLFGLEAGFLFQMVWAILGVILVYYFICARKKKLLVWPLLILIGFSGLDILGNFIIGNDVTYIASDTHLEWWISPYQYSSNTTQLFWVFNQSIPAWLCTMMALLQKNNRSIIFILACCMLSSTFPFVGLLVIVLFLVFTRKYERIEEKDSKIKSYARAFVKDTFTIQNIVGGGVIGIFTFLYLMSNLAGNQIMKTHTENYILNNNLAKYIIFILVEVGIYLIFLYKYNKNNGLYYVVLFSLCIIPPIRVGSAADFCMRVSIPALFILMLLVIDALENALEKKEYLILIGLIITLFIGASTPLHEITRTFKNTIESLNEGKSPSIAEKEYDEMKGSILNSTNFSGATDESIFFKYIAK